MSTFESAGVVLRRKKINAFDCYLTVFSRAMGRIEVYARNANDPKSPLNKGAQPFVYALFSLSGSKQFSLRSVEVYDSFYGLRTDTEQMLMASLLSQVVLQLFAERESNKTIFEAIVNSLSLFHKFPAYMASSFLHFYGVCLKELGIKPHVDTCMSCAVKEAYYFDIPAGGVYCEAHQESTSIYAKETVLMLRRLFSEDLKTFLNRRPGAEDVELTLNQIEEYIDHHLETQLKQTRQKLDEYQ